LLVMCQSFFQLIQITFMILIDSSHMLRISTSSSAHTEVLYCFPFLGDFTDFLVISHHVEVYTLSCWAILPYPSYYRLAFAFSTIPYPHSISSPCDYLLAGSTSVRCAPRLKRYILAT